VLVCTTRRLVVFGRGARVFFKEEPNVPSLASWKRVCSSGHQKKSFAFVVVVKKRLAGHHCATTIGEKTGFQSAGCCQPGMKLATGLFTWLKILFADLFYKENIAE